MSTQLNSLDYSPRDFKGYGANPPNAQWPGGAKIAISIVVNYEEGSELCPSTNGDKMTETACSELGPGLKPMLNQRDPNIESLFEYGSRVGVWRLFRLFESLKVPVTAFACAKALEVNTDVAEGFVRGGHEVGSHGYRWIDRSAQTADEEYESIVKCIRSIKNTTGKAPVGNYWGHVESEGGSRSRGLCAKAWKDEGVPLKWYSDDYSDDLPHWVPYPGGTKDEGLLIVPYDLTINDFAFNSGYKGPYLAEDYETQLKAAFDEYYLEGSEGSPKMMSIGLHCRIIGRPARIAALRNFIKYAQSKGDVWFATREQIADHWAKVHPYKPAE